MSVAISKAGTNELLEEYCSLTEILPYRTEVKGISYEKRSNVALAAKLGQRLDLVRDYDNPFDRNAIAVVANGQIMGYLNRHLAQLAAVDIDCGLELKAEIVQIDGVGVPEVSIELRERDTSEKNNTGLTGAVFDISTGTSGEKNA